MSGGFDCEVLVVGGGPAGAATGVFTARAGLDTQVYDRGPSSLQQCAHLPNFLGFPAGIDVATFDDLADAHVREAGGTVRDSHVEAVERDGRGFRVETDGADGGGTVTARRVVAATNETDAYLDPLADAFDGSFDPDAVDADGRTPVDDLYVAGPLGGGPDQALVAAGHGARVGCAVAVDAREDGAHWPEVARHYHDWTPRESAYDDGWEASVATWVRDMVPESRDVAPETVERVIEHQTEHERGASIDAETAEERRRDAHRALLEHLDDEVIRAYLDERDA